MRGLFYRHLPATLACLLLAKVLYAQQAPVTTVTPAVPRVVRITSTFRPASGAPAGTVESVTLSIYKEEHGGTPLWQETQNVSLDPEGRFTVLMGSTLPDGIPIELFTAGELRWLAVKFNRPDEAEPARVLYASVPYALKAADADTLGGRPASDYLLASAAGTGNTATSASADSTTPLAVVPGALSGGGTNGCIARFNGAYDVGCSGISETGGLVGIGQGAPLDRLHLTFNDTTGSMTGLAVQNLGSGASSYSGMLFYDQNGALGQFQGFNNSTHEYRINNIASGGTINFMIGGGSKFKVLNNGDVQFNGFAKLRAPVDSTVALGSGGALASNTGTGNTAIGYSTMTGPGGGASNAALGAFALQLVGGGDLNTGVGYAAGWTVATGSNNIFIGSFAGNNVGDPRNNNIEIGSGGAPADNGVIRIGDSGNQSKFFAGAVRGITTVNNNAIPVLIDSAGQLGTVSSSRRFKEDIQDMGDASLGLMRLRPVTFRYKQPFGDGSKPVQYGLIAEEVEEVYPDLVAHSADGQIETVKYQVLDSMLLNEIQRQQTEIDVQKERIRVLEERLAKLESALTARPPR